MCSVVRSEIEMLSFLILETYYYIPPLVGVVFLALTPIWIIIAAKHPATRTVLHSGWEPVITAMVISRLVLKCVCLWVIIYARICIYIKTNQLPIFISHPICHFM